MHNTLWRGVLGLLLVGLVWAWVVLLVPGTDRAAGQAVTPACHDTRLNALGTAGASIAVSTAAVPVVAANTSRCRLTLTNETANAVRCATTSGKYPLTPSTTVGYMIVASGTLTIASQAGQQAWSCIRQGGTDSALSVLEELP